MPKRVELQNKCRRLFYAKTDGPPFIEVVRDDDGNELSRNEIVGTFQHVAGDILGVASGGGALEGLTDDDLVIATFNDETAPERIGCIEEYYNPLSSGNPLRIDLTKVQSCCDAVNNHRAAKQAEADFVFEKGITLFGSESQTTKDLRHVLKVQEMHTRNNADRVSDHDAILQAQTDLEALCKTCDDCCEEVLVTRDAAVTFKSDGA